MSAFDVALGEWMAEERESRAISQETVAQQMQVDQPTVSKIERGQRRMTVEELLVWANVLGMPTVSVCSALDRLRSQLLPDASIWAASSE